MVAQAVQAELDRRNLTLNAFSQRYGFDRGTFTRFANTGHATLEFVERWARTMDLDVNHWRELCGYPRVESSPTDGLRAAIKHIQELEYDPEFADWEVRNFNEKLASMSPHDQEIALRLMRAAMSEQRRAQGRE